MKKLTIAVASAILIFSASANALTLKKGQVISGGEVVNAEDSANVQRQLSNDGVAVVAGIVLIELNGEVIKIPADEIRGKSKAQVKEILGDAVVEQMEDLYDAAEAEVVAIIEAGEIDSAVNAVGKSVEEILDEIDLDAASGAVVGISEQQNRDLCDAMPDCVHPEDIE